MNKMIYLLLMSFASIGLSVYVYSFNEILGVLFSLIGVISILLCLGGFVE